MNSLKSRLIAKCEQALTNNTEKAKLINSRLPNRKLTEENKENSNPNYLALLNSGIVPNQKNNNDNEKKNIRERRVNSSMNMNAMSIQENSMNENYNTITNTNINTNINNTNSYYSCNKTIINKEKEKINSYLVN